MCKRAVFKNDTPRPLLRVRLVLLSDKVDAIIPCPCCCAAPVLLPHQFCCWFAVPAECALYPLLTLYSGQHKFACHCPR